jgi:hypothetical protein
MKTYRRTVQRASPLPKADPQYHPATKIREARAALRQAALLFTEAALCVSDPLHERKLLALSSRAEEATKPLGRICRTLEVQLAR